MVIDVSVNSSKSALLEESKKPMKVLEAACHNISYSTRSQYVDISTDFYLELISRNYGHFTNISGFSEKWPLFRGMNFIRNSGYTDDLCTSLPQRQFPTIQYFTSLHNYFGELTGFKLLNN